MKTLRLTAGSVLFLALAACAATPDEAGTARGMVVEADGLTTLAPETAAAVKATGLAVNEAGLRGRPIYEPGDDAVAYFEVDLGANGWAVVTASAPAHVVEHGTSGRAPTARLELGARAAMKKVYRLDPAIYVAADGEGRALGRSTKSLLRIDRSSDRATFVPVTSDEAIQIFRAARTDLLNASKRGLATQADSPLIGGTPPQKTCTVPGIVPSYTQLDAGEGPNTTACASGCGPTAWATIFGWASRRAAENPANDAPFAGLLPNAPATMNGDVAKLSMTLNAAVGTFCADGEGATTPWSMEEIGGLVSARAPGVVVDAHYNFLMTPDNVVRDATIDALCDGRPSIVGTGTLFGGDAHYPIAKAYSNGKFELEMGWGGDGNGWYDATTWYMGSLRHD